MWSFDFHVEAIIPSLSNGRCGARSFEKREPLRSTSSRKPRNESQLSEVAAIQIFYLHFVNKEDLVREKNYVTLKEKKLMCYLPRLKNWTTDEFQNKDRLNFRVVGKVLSSASSFDIGKKR